MPPPEPTPEAHTMQCMEVWGGNRDVETAVSTQGLDAWVVSHPFAGENPETDAGGDIHYLTSCATGRITRMLLADVSGHGEAVATAARSLRRLLGQHANYIEQDRFMGAVNARFGRLDGATEGLFATAVVATYFTPTDELTLCSAGHPPALLYRAGEDRWAPIGLERRGEAPSNLPLGVLDTSAYEQSTLTLAEGDLLLMYTDALIEAPGPDGRQLGVEGLTRIASTLDARDPARFIPGLLRAVLGADDGARDAFDDDVTALLIRRNTFKPRPSIGLALVAGLRILRNVIVSPARGVRPALPEISLRALGGAFFKGFNTPRT